MKDLLIAEVQTVYGPTQVTRQHFEYVGTYQPARWDSYTSVVHCSGGARNYSGITTMVEQMTEDEKKPFVILDSYVLPDLMRVEMWSGDLAFSGAQQNWFTIYC